MNPYWYLKSFKNEDKLFFKCFNWVENGVKRSAIDHSSCFITKLIKHIRVSVENNVFYTFQFYIFDFWNNYFTLKYKFLTLYINIFD